ncbi:MAG TPA: HPF/RaiA family ribosome-associated protein [bacterium]|nr:HPF/RaiA family ribosome-associated protein [bacterium]HOL66924.1 HPF/RaiA family ribosome-associated protein [bacterium]HPP12418.1 HPF/RaiA family ribosome-associated protein [bacterium]
MEIRIHFKTRVDSDFEGYIREKMQRLEKLTFGTSKADFYVRNEGSTYVAELVIHTGHQTVFLKESDNDLNRCVEVLLDKARTKLSRLHDKVIEQSHR